MGGCQNYGPFVGPLNIRGRITMGIQKGTMILTTTNMSSIFCGDTQYYPNTLTPMMENQMEKTMENEMDAEII